MLAHNSQGIGKRETTYKLSACPIVRVYTHMNNSI